MKDASITVTYTKAAAQTGADTGDWLRLEQESAVDEASLGNFNSWLAANEKGLSLDTVFGYLDEYMSQCEEGGEFECIIRVYKSRDDLEYTMKASYGELSERFVESENIVRSEDVEGGMNYILDVMVDGEIEAEWEGPTYLLSGEVVTPPEVTIDGNELFWNLPVYGTLRLKYTEKFDWYALQMEPREDEDTQETDETTAYTSTIRAFWVGGVEALEVSPPSATGNCKGGAAFEVNPSDDDGSPSSHTCYNRVITVNPCDVTDYKEELKKVTCDEAVDAALSEYFGD